MTPHHNSHRSQTLKRRYEVVVIGSGVAGLSALYHLQRLGVTSVALSTGAPETASSRHSMGMLWGGQVDNFTRISHALGRGFAAELWRFGDLAFDELIHFAAEHHLGVCHGRRQRLITSPSELIEAEKAAAELQQEGLTASLIRRSDDRFPSADLTSRVAAIQDEGPRGAVIDRFGLIAAIDNAARLPDSARLGRTNSLDLSASGAILWLEDGSEVHCELVIVCAHLGTGELIPELHEALVPFADQWTEIRLARSMPAWTGTAFSANHTHEWGVFAAPDTVRIGGGRYLRPLAGVEAKHAAVTAEITAHLLEQFSKTFTFAHGAHALMSAASREIRPCDELPVIGPMFGSGRALIATGFMGAGLTLGFLAGRCLAELVKTGKCDILPRRLWPERLRSLES